MSHCLIGLGSNLGDRQSNLDSAIARFGELPDVKVVARSRWLGTDPIGGPVGQGDFLNGAAIVETSLKPMELLQQLRGIESSLGRQRRIRWDSRTIDVDILLFDDICVETDVLTVPHPRMICRRFVLEPAAEIAADWKHPIQRWTIGQLFDHLNAKPPRFVVTGSELKTLRDLVKQIAARSHANLLAFEDLHESPVCTDAIATTSLESSPTICLLNGSEPYIDAMTRWAPKLFMVPEGVGPGAERGNALKLRDRLIRSQLAPVLTITSDNPNTIVAESVAAIESMK